MQRKRGCRPTPRHRLARQQHRALPRRPARSARGVRRHGRLRLVPHVLERHAGRLRRGRERKRDLRAHRGQPRDADLHHRRRDQGEISRRLGGADDGLDIESNLQYENQHAIVAPDGSQHKPGPYGSVDATQIAEFAKACYYFGRLKIAIACPDQLANSNPGDVIDWPAGQDPGQADHCVLVCGARTVNGARHWKLVTWGGIRWVDDQFIISCCGQVGEAWAVYDDQDRLKPDGTTIEGFDESQLLADWAAFNGQVPPSPGPAPGPSPTPTPGPAPDPCDLAKRGVAVLQRGIVLAAAGDGRAEQLLKYAEGFLA